MTPTRNRKGALAGLLLCAVLAWAGAAAGQQDRGMGVPADILPEDLQKLDVKDHYIPTNFREVGVLHALNGHVVVVHRADGQAYFGRPGDKIYENDELNTLGDSRCRVRFYSDDVVNMAPNTRFAVETFEDRRKEGEKTSVFSMIKGKAMFYALRLFRYKEARFKVQTPTAIVGVRGTKFGLDVFWLDGGQTAARPLRVADSGRGFDAFLAQAQGQGRTGGTHVACGDGVLDVVDPASGDLLTFVNPNEDFNTYTGRKVYDPTNRVLNGIQQVSQVREEGEDEDQPPTQPTVEGDEGAAADDTGMPELAFLAAAPTDVVLQQTGEDTQTEAGMGYQGIVPFEGTSCCPLKGYFSALLIYASGPSMDNIKDVLSSFSLQQLDPTVNAMGTGTISTNHTVEVNGDDYPLEAEFTQLTGSYSPIKVTEGELVGQYNYLQWGYDWVETSVFSISTDDFKFLSKGWYVEGFNTTAAEIASLSGSYPYSGNVNGTYYDPSETVDISGSYSCNVDFGSSTIQNFQLNASGGSHTVAFTQSGTATVDADGQFGTQITGPAGNMGGDFKIDGNTTSFYEVNGAHYGDRAQEQGGAFAGFYSSSNAGVYGVFAGERP